MEDALSEPKVGFDATNLDWLALPNLGVVKLRYTYFLFKNERTDTIDEHPVCCVDPTTGGAKEIVEKKKVYAEYHGARDEMRELLVAKSNVDRLLNITATRVERENAHVETHPTSETK